MRVAFTLFWTPFTATEEFYATLRHSDVQRKLFGMTLKQIVYVSAARSDLDDQDHAQILATARRRNAGNGLTGMLLCVDHGFLQLLEGPADAVDETFARIAMDPRHISVRKLYDAPAEKRNFGGWFMGFHDLRGGTALTEGAFPVTKAALMDNLPAGLGTDVLILIRTFYTVNAAA